ncbi:MAG: ASKHA domain-containing protein [Clostridiales Family XIII bacterium]|nr:ASKHA domain-containing protein [Clostridiales Family XIII bacterium]
MIQKILVDSDNEKSLLALAAEQGLMIDSPCGGRGACRKCRIYVVGIGEVLSCRFYPKADLEVEISDEGDIGYSEGFSTDEIDNHAFTYQAPHQENLNESIRPFGIAIDVGTTSIAGACYDLDRGERLARGSVANRQTHYGADVVSRIEYAIQNTENLQHIHDAVIDSITELIYNLTKLMNKKQLKSKYNTINSDANDDNPQHYEIVEYCLTKVVFCGNTTMTHLLLNVNPSSLATAPFASRVVGLVHGLLSDLISASKLYQISKDGKVAVASDAAFTVLPIIGSHVGSDITSDIVAVQKIYAASDSAMNYLLIDIGTNGEMVLSVDGKRVACSTAAGPAFEGGGLTCGMRAVNGAINQVWYDKAIQDIGYFVIGGDDNHHHPIKGICGSGIIDVLAAFLDSGLMDNTGRLVRPGDAAYVKLSHALQKRIRQIDGIWAIAFTSDLSGRDVYITQKDIREIQMAKSAICAGALTLLSSVSIDIDRLDSIYIAGAFGSSIDIEQACRIGLLPKVKNQSVYDAIGNSALVGTTIAMLYERSMSDIEATAEETESIELANSTIFAELYMDNMEF